MEMKYLVYCYKAMTMSLLIDELDELGIPYEREDLNTIIVDVNNPQDYQLLDQYATTIRPLLPNILRT